MQVIFLPKRKILIWGLITATLILLILWLSLWQQITSVPTITEPIYQGMDTEKQISLTFNVDWGQEFLSEMLDALEKNEAKATFYLTGRWAEKFPNDAMDISRAGHEIGNHGLKHNSPNAMSLEQNRQDIKEAEKIIEQVTGKKTTLFAPASGERNDHVLKAAESLGYTTILWSIDTVDWRRDKSPDQIVSKVVDKAHNGAIVLMHPTEATAKALPGMINELKNEGYKIVPVSKILSDNN
ncbi:polysaccharide deacetylase family protein [Metallumcola ferriviriculae]|uniref:Polysaccharide deacetylase family protein n=1 Tax=Metallumcola ferriviriculae TaxID=3039180 RepID=A0AAU0UQ35_9FIRM|nr:polysaccharide deacetylase family protein [Desulfitibacteraceae bacterium MK1]